MNKKIIKIKKIKNPICVWDFCANSQNGNSWADIWATTKGYFISVFDGDFPERCGLFKIPKTIYEKWEKAGGISLKTNEFDNIYKKYPKIDNTWIV